MPGQRDVAIDLMKQQKFSEAIPIFLELIANDSDDWSLCYMAGQCYRMSNNLPEAKKLLTKSASLNPKEPQTFLALGIALQLAEEYNLAIEKLKQAVALDPTLFSAYNSIGLTYRRLEQFREALEWYGKAAEGINAAVTDEVFKDRKRCFRDEIVDGKKTVVVLPYAMEKTHELLRSQPIYAIVKNNIGVCLLQLGDIEAAREQFKESIEFIPDGYDYSDPYKYLADIGE